MSELTSAQAVYGIMAWLTTRHEQIVMSRRDEAGPAAEATAAFCKANGIDTASIDRQWQWMAPEEDPHE